MNLRCEYISVAAHRFDQTRAARINLEFSAQTAHLIVNAAVKELRGAACGKVQELVAAEHHVRPMHQHLQKTELSGAEGNRQRICALQLALLQIKHP